MEYNVEYDFIVSLEYSQKNFNQEDNMKESLRGKRYSTRLTNINMIVVQYLPN